MSPRSEKQLQEIRKKSRENLLETAFELFALKGYHNTSISQIADKAGVAKGLVYKYFENKKDLMHQIVLTKVNEGDQIFTHLVTLETAEEKLRYILGMSFDYIVEYHHESKLMFALSLQIEEFPELTSIVADKYSGFLPILGHLLAELGIENPEMEAKVLIAMLDGIGMQHIVMGDTVQLEELKNYLIHKYCKTS